MCGLIGVYGDLYYSHLKFFKQALIADYVRGNHSTGMTAVKANGDVFNKKLAIDPINFLELKSVDNNILVTNTLIMGHNRHATLGGVNAANAHPFEHDHITLMHNGTLSNKYSLQTKHNAPVFDTDSELVCWLLSQHSVEDIIPLLEGAFALTWYDAKDKSFNFIRNDERPMAMAVAEDSVLYASEWRMLAWLMERNSLKTKDFEMVSPEKGKHHKFTYDKKIVTQVVTDIPLYVAPVYKYEPYQYNQGAYQDGYKAGSNVKKLPRGVGNSNDERFQQYQTEFGGDIKRNDIIFAYVDKVVARAYNGDTHFDLEMSLVSSPYTTVKAYYIKKELYPEIDKAFVVRGKVTSVYMHSDDPYFILDPEFDIINETTDKYYTEYEALAGEESFGFEEREDDISDEDSIVMIGHDRTLITASEFRKATAHGCFVCKQTIDAEKEIKDMQECMIVGETTAVCQHCIDHYEHCLQFSGAM